MTILPALCFWYAKCVTQFSADVISGKDCGLAKCGRVSEAFFLKKEVKMKRKMKMKNKNEKENEMKMK